MPRVAPSKNLQQSAQKLFRPFSSTTSILVDEQALGIWSSRKLSYCFRFVPEAFSLYSISWLLYGLIEQGKFYFSLLLLFWTFRSCCEVYSAVGCLILLRLLTVSKCHVWIFLGYSCCWGNGFQVGTSARPFLAATWLRVHTDKVLDIWHAGREWVLSHYKCLVCYFWSRPWVLWMI